MAGSGGWTGGQRGVIAPPSGPAKQGYGGGKNNPNATGGQTTAPVAPRMPTKTGYQLGANQRAPKPVSPGRTAPVSAPRPTSQGGNRGGGNRGGGNRGGYGGQYLGNGISANNPLLQPGASLSGKPLYDAAMGLATAQTQPTLDGLARAIAQSDRSTQAATKLTGGYFNQLQGDANQAVDQTKQIGTDLNTQLQGIGQQTQSQLGQLGQQASQGGIANLNSMGIGNGYQALQAELARQQGLAAQTSGNQQAAGALQGANYSSYASNGKIANTAAGIAALKGVTDAGLARTEPLNAKLADTQATKGADFSDALSKLRQQSFSNDVAASTLNYHAKAVNNAAAQNRARDNLTRRGQDLQYKAALKRATQAAANSNPNQVGTPAWQRYQDNQIRQWSNNPNAVGSPAWSRVQSANSRSANGPNVKLPKYTPTGTPTLAPALQTRLFGDVGVMAKSLIPEMQRPLSANAAKSLQAAGYNFQAGQKLSEGQIRQFLSGGMHPGGKTRYDPALVDAAFAMHGWGHITDKQIAELNKLGLIVGTRLPRGVAPNSVPAGYQNTAPSGGALH